MTALTVVGTGCAKRQPAATDVSEAVIPDQLLDSMSFVITDAGVKLSEVSADTARVFSGQRQEMELQKLTMVFYDSIGYEQSRITADSGIYHIRDGTLDARGNVIVTTPPPESKVLKTSHLLYDKGNRSIEVDTNYTWNSSEGRGSGKSFTSNTDFSYLRQIQPKAVQKGKGIVIPKTGPGTP